MQGKPLNQSVERCVNIAVIDGRLILLTKTGHPISDLNNTRPILVQNIIIRLIEKVIKTELEK